MVDGSRLRDTLAWAKIYFDRGNSLLNPLRYFLFGYWIAAPSLLTVLVTSAMWAATCMIIGRLDYFKGFMKVEAGKNTRDVNPVFRQMQDDIAEIKAKLEKISKEAATT